MSKTLSRSETWSLLALSVGCLAVIFQTFQGDGAPLVASLALSGLAFASCYAMIRWLGETFMKAGLKGKDMSKKGRPEMYAALLATRSMATTELTGHGQT